jgi:hypothetical protein
MAENTGVVDPALLKDIGGGRREAAVEDPVMRGAHRLQAKFDQLAKALDLLYASDKRKEAFVEAFGKLLEPKADREFVRDQLEELKTELRNDF